MGKLLEELKRRKVFRVAAIYAVVAWGLIQVADTIAPMMNLPESAPRLVLFLLIILFPVAVFLAWAYEVTPEGIKPDFTAQAVPSAASNTNNTDRKLIYAIFALVLLVAGFQLSDRFLSGNELSANRSAGSARVTTNAAVVRSSIILDQSLTRSTADTRTILDLAPDSSALAFANVEQNHWMLRNLATGEAQDLENTTGGKAKFSPNSQNLLLFSGPDQATGVLSVRSGQYQPLPIEGTPSATWLSDEDIIYRSLGGETRILSLEDRSEVTVPDFDTEQAGFGHYQFNSLPSGSAFLYLQRPSDEESNDYIVQAYDLNNQSKTLVTNDGYFPQYVNSGHVLFLRQGDLWAVPFDADSLSVTGQDARVLEGIEGQPSMTWGAYSVSDSGRLVYLSTNRNLIEGETILYSADRLGNREEVPLLPGNYAEPRLSPNGELLALTSNLPDGSSDIWVYNFASEVFNPVTFSGDARTPVWTPDGSQLVYQRSTGLYLPTAPRGELWIMNANGTGLAERIFDGPAKADSFSPIDGKLIYFSNAAGAGTINLSTLTYGDNVWIPAPLFPTENSMWGARVSPDGRWIAYGSTESGTMQIYVQPYPNLDGKWQITSDVLGSREPSWGPEGDELFFLRLDGNLMHAEITVAGDSISSGVVRPLVSGLETVGSSPLYAVSNDGERFFHLSPATSDSNIVEGRAELLVIDNFFEELKRLAPADSQ